jgi:cytokinesis protein
VKAREAAAQNGPDDEDATVLDNLLEKLRKGENPRRARRARPNERNAIPLSLDIDTTSAGGPGAETADIARDMLARLKSDGFETFPPSSPLPNSSTSTPMKRSRRTRSQISKIDLEFSEALQSSPPLGTVSIPEEATPEPPAEAPSRPSPPQDAGHPPITEDEEWDRTIIAAVT